jgi:hypothetical protein
VSEKKRQGPETLTSVTAEVGHHTREPGGFDLGLAGQIVSRYLPKQGIEFTLAASRRCMSACRAARSSRIRISDRSAAATSSSVGSFLGVPG